MKFLISLFTVSLFFIHTTEASARPIINCQIQGYEASPQVASDYLKKFEAKTRIKVGNWESCYKRATLFTKSYPAEVTSFGFQTVFHNGVRRTIVGSLKKYRVYKWIYKVSKGNYISGIITKHTDSHVVYPKEGPLLFDEGGVLLNVDTSPIE